MCYTRRKIEGGVGALREYDDTNFLKPNGQSRNLNIYDWNKGLYSAYHWLICLTYIYYAWYYQTSIVSPAFSFGVTALKLCRAISDAKDDP